MQCEAKNKEKPQNFIQTKTLPQSSLNISILRYIACMARLQTSLTTFAPVNTVVKFSYIDQNYKKQRKSSKKKNLKDKRLDTQERGMMAVTLSISKS